MKFKGAILGVDGNSIAAAQDTIDCSATCYVPPSSEDECDEIRDNALTDEYARYNRMAMNIQKRRKAALDVSGEIRQFEIYD